MNAYRWLLDKFQIPNGSTYVDPPSTLRQSASWIEEYIQAKITSGELMVVKSAKPIDGCCSNCDMWIGDGPNYCPGCGSKIIE